MYTLIPDVRVYLDREIAEKLCYSAVSDQTLSWTVELSTDFPQLNCFDNHCFLSHRRNPMELFKYIWSYLNICDAFIMHE